MGPQPHAPDVCGKGLERKASGFSLMAVQVEKLIGTLTQAVLQGSPEVSHVYSAILERKKL